MKKHVRFRKGLDSYPQGSSHHLPVELADLFIKSGVAEEVDCRPVEPVVEPVIEDPPVVEPVKEEPPAVEVEVEPAADEAEAEVSETETDADTATTTRKRRK